jgi:acyl-CoA synthetase (AMP-forming)/AMP-acid ligase II
MYPGRTAEELPDKPAVVMAGSGEVVTYAELEARSCRLARLFRAAGLQRGDHVALFLENHPRYLEVYWAAMRSGLYLTTVNRYLTSEEAAYIVDDCGARALVTSAALVDAAQTLPELAKGLELRLMMDGACAGYQAYESAVAEFPGTPPAEQPLGSLMLYSSGTTGRPKGVWRPMRERQVTDGDPALLLIPRLFGWSADSVYLSPAPLYHSAPIAACASVHGLGGTVVVLERFDPRAALAAIERYRVTHGQWVPTMFTRMLKLPDEERARYDVSSQRSALHAAAPCPVHVKERMIEWWGPILDEYYGGTELNGLTFIKSDAWLSHRGSVGRAVLGTLHICDEAGDELPAGQDGLIYFELPEMPFAYHKDEEKTRRAQHPKHANWSALGDVGHVDDDGYLYLTDRKDFMIVSGGVNIYPAEIENALVAHAKVLDAAVFGVPNDEFGEEVKAVVQLVEDASPSQELEQALLEHCREHLAGFKCPRSVDFTPELPRLPTGKLYKRLLRDRYWGEHETRIV